MADTPEGKVKKAIKKVLARRGIFYFMPVNNGMGRGGVSDFICVVPTVVTPDMVGKHIGVFTAIEAKAPGKGATDRQKEFLTEVTERRGVGYVTDDAEELDAAMEKECSGRKTST